MSELFARLYFDENVDLLVVEYLRPEPFDILTARGAGNLGLSDPSQLEFAARERRVMVTHNRGDFEGLHRAYLAAGRSHAGILILFWREGHELARRLAELLNRLSADEIEGQILYL